MLGEHHVRNVGVVGSNPIISTTETKAGDCFLRLLLFMTLYARGRAELPSFPVPDTSLRPSIRRRAAFRVRRAAVSLRGAIRRWACRNAARASGNSLISQLRVFPLFSRETP